MASLLLVAANGAYASAPPINDDWANATTIPAISPAFVTSEENMYLATMEGTDPVPPCVPLNAPGVSSSLWYKYTPTAPTEYMTLTIPDNKIVGIVTVYTGNPTDGFRIVSGGCSHLSDDINITRVAGLRLSAGVTYSIEVAAIFPVGAPVNGSNTLSFSVESAATYAVTKTADTSDGTCDADCSLREAISASNAVPGAVLIPAGTYTLAIAGVDEYGNASGSLDVLHGMGIYGAGMQQTVIDANQLDRVLHLDPVASGTTHANFAIADLTLTRGHAVPTSLHNAGGGGLLLQSNSDYFGLERVAVSASSSDYISGGVSIFSPGILSDCAISDNTTPGFGAGGLYLAVDGAPHYIEISGSTVSGNSATSSSGIAGGIYLAAGPLRVNNSTISGNHATYDGGGIYVGNNGSLKMASSTVVLNSAQTNPNKTFGGGGVHLENAGSSSIVNSILAYNTVANPDDPPDCGAFGGTLASAYNVVGSISVSCGFTGTGDITGVDPGVSHTLANNGGLTKTHALLSNSVAQDSGDPAGCKDATGLLDLAYDQRGAGFARVANGNCDKGAFEFVDKIFFDGFD